jgi:CO/xanthine dehydrogenase Mo-binding subunit
MVANVLPDGKVSLIEGSIDIGGTRTAAAQQFAEALGIPAEDIRPQVADTDVIGPSAGAGGSSVTHSLGFAAYEAAQDVQRQLVQRAATLWETSADHVEYTGGALRHKSDPELRITFKELAGMLDRLGGPVVGRANTVATGAGGSYAAVVVDVEVDPETGKVQVPRYTVFQDAGTAIHPGYVEGQMQGGAAQGAGWALHEEYVMGEDGGMLNTSFLDYRMPTALDLPPIETVIVEKPNPGHPFGVRGVGEASLVPPMAAFANAVYDAVGVRMRELPMSPSAVLAAIEHREESQQGPPQL